MTEEITADQERIRTIEHELEHIIGELHKWQKQGRGITLGDRGEIMSAIALLSIAYDLSRIREILECGVSVNNQY